MYPLHTERHAFLHIYALTLSLNITERAKVCVCGFIQCYTHSHKLSYVCFAYLTSICIFRFTKDATSHVIYWYWIEGRNLRDKYLKTCNPVPILKRRNNNLNLTKHDC